MLGASYKAIWSMQPKEAPIFGRWRSLFWPIHGRELKKFLPLLLMFALISFNYNLLRSYKDSVVITATSSGAEVLPFIKVWAILPGAVLLTFLFTKLANRYSREKVFYVMMALFLAFFFLFTFVLYPARNFLHPNEFADKLQLILPEGFKGLIAMFRNWTLTLFYVMAELWGTAILSVLFWGFTNEVTSVSESKRYYGILTTGANLACFFAAELTVHFNASKLFFPWVPYGDTSWDQSILFLNCIILLNGVATVAIFRWLNRHAIKPTMTEKGSHEAPEKIKMSMRQNFAYLAKSPYLLCIAGIVLTYNLVMNLAEVVWKNQINQLYPDPSEFTVYFGEVMAFMAVIATFAGLFVTNSFIRKSWTLTALVPPLITLIFGACFFLFTLFQHWDVRFAGIFFGTTPLFLSVFFGSLQNSMSRACKYTLYDATKEMAFIPLSPESKLKGKAVIDGVGSRLGKSAGSVIHQGLILILSSVASSTPYVAALFFAVIFIWILSVISLGKQFETLSAHKQTLTLPEDPLLVKEGT
ncbi:MAG TPA: Npt1/Npt2 family nucleotide transporter [Chlamydiales bacterium]|nr:Npt1/Npt2 family nucleotide transporter [Chlamydiales bacterium]